MDWPDSLFQLWVTDSWFQEAVVARTGLVASGKEPGLSTTEVARTMLKLISSLGLPKILEVSQYPVLNFFLPKIVVSMIAMDSNITAFHFYYAFFPSKKQSSCFVL